MIPERERVALMRLTMCARKDCVMCEYKEQCNFDFQYELATKNMNILAEALRKLNSSEKPNNCEELNAYRKCVESRSFWDNKHCDGCYFDERCPFDEPKDEPKLCRECEKYAGDGMYCASNHLVYDFDTCKDEPQTERSE